MKSVLICDDATFMRVLLKNLLEKNGFLIVGEAATGIQAVEKYKELMPDIVTMDITMPEMDGIQATKEIVKINSNAMILMVSAMGQQAMIIESVKAGALSFIVKPFKEEAVMGALKKLLNQ